MIEINNINLEYENKIILSDFSFKVNKSEIIGIKGESGIGKTTLLNAIMGFILPKSGNIIIDNYELNKNNINLIRQKISYIPQNFNIGLNKKVKDLFDYIFGFGFNKKIKLSNEIIFEEFSLLNLDKMIYNSEFQKLSGGEKQRILIILAKLLNRDIILADEPSSALDENSKVALIKYLVNRDKTMIIVSHDNELLSFCNRIIEL